MQKTRISDVVQRRITGGLVVLALSLGSVALAAPAQAAEFSARIGSVAHNAGDVAVTGNGDPGDLVEVTPSDGAPVQTRVKPNGTWRTVAHVDGPGDHTFRVTDSIGSPARTLAATTRDVSYTGLVVVRENWERSLLVRGSGFEPRAHVDLTVDGVPRGTTTVDRDGAFAHRISGMAFGQHTVTTSERFDGAEQLRINSSALLEPFPVVDDVRVDPAGHLVHLAGRGPAGTDMRFVDESGAPWPLTDGTDWITNADGTWTADVAYPGVGTRFMGIVAEVYDDGKLVGSTTTSATIPFPVTAVVTKYTAKKLVLSGTAEPGARLSFVDADGTPVTDADGNRVEPPVPGTSKWTVTLDPRRMAGGTVTATVTGDEGVHGNVTLTYR
ncbi:hypothetical protein EDF24_0322 [Curtobacterium sp. PhB130]|uniref:hypothetical protein n=1 Tax=unclassified Curtobacterium TaxID=257496 RepID=UPI000FC0AA94|nr:MULTISPECIES: hypothetical protein [unclassified Curtobacterium]ROS77564.1 hypothetical protein EDF24_0322 [Curtobacterium sp. PhB130]TCK66229.1 hypothetical protein EDF27_0982 [Curtobacterium sp. PhB136]